MNHQPMVGVLWGHLIEGPSGTRGGFPEEALFELRPRMKLTQLLSIGASAAAVFAFAK